MRLAQSEGRGLQAGCTDGARLRHHVECGAGQHVGAVDFDCLERDFAGTRSLESCQRKRRPDHDARTVRGQGDEQLAAIAQDGTGDEELCALSGRNPGNGTVEPESPGRGFDRGGSEPARRGQVRDADGREGAAGGDLAQPVPGGVVIRCRFGQPSDCRIMLRQDENGGEAAGCELGVALYQQRARARFAAEFDGHAPECRAGFLDQTPEARRPAWSVIGRAVKVGEGADEIQRSLASRDRTRSTSAIRREGDS